MPCPIILSCASLTVQNDLILSFFISMLVDPVEENREIELGEGAGSLNDDIIPSSEVKLSQGASVGSSSTC